MMKLFPVFSIVKAISLANQEASNTRHPSETKPQVIPNSTTESLKVIDYEVLKTDPGIKPSISSYHPNIQDKVRKAYLKIGPHQPSSNFIYPWSDHGKQRRRFCKNWFNLYNWIEYSESKDLAFCLPCFLFKNYICLKVVGITLWEMVFVNGRILEDWLIKLLISKILM
jgi:hypothetical protein